MSSGGGGSAAAALPCMPDVGSLSLDQPTAGATTSAADDAPFPVVTRMFADEAGPKLEQRMHALLSADLHFKPCTGRAKDAPASFVDFRGARDCVRLKRLPPVSTIDDVCSAVAGKYMPATYGDCALVVSSCVRERDGRSEGKAGPADVVLVLGSVELAQEWLEALRMRVMPWELIRERVKATFTESAAVNEAEGILQAMKEAVAKDHETINVEEEPPRATVGRARDYLRWLARVGKFSSVANVVAPSTAAFVKASEVGDTVTRVLGGVALAGPILSVAMLGLRCGELAAQARDYRVSLGRLLSEELPQASRRLALSGYHILSCSVPSDSMDGIVGGVFKALEECWSLLELTERQLLDMRRNQIRHTDRSEQIMQSVRNLSLELRFAQQGEALAESWEAIGAIGGRMKELEKGIRKREDMLVQSIYVGPPAPKVVSRSALPPQFEQLLSAVLDGGTVSVSDGSARTGDNSVSSGNAGSSATKSAPILSVEGQGGVGKTTTLLLVADDDRVREHFDYRLFLQLGQEATEADVVTALADLVQATGGLDVADEIRNLAPGKNRLQLAVNRTEIHLGLKRVLLLLDNVWTRACKASESAQPWVEVLARIASKPGSAVLVSTRQEGVARCADEGKRFEIGLLKDRTAAMSIFELHAELEPGAALPGKPLNAPVLEEELKQYDSVVDYVLEVCDGWPLALAMCGAMVRSSGYRWRTIGRRIRASVVEVASGGQGVKHPGMQAVFLSNVTHQPEGGGADPLAAAGEARRARHEHEAAAESKPARPDPVDMNEEEKEMLSEARARLANTRGKKAKRKAREKQLEAAKRLAQLQKRRELKAAGIETKPRKRKRDVMDLATEVPFARAPVPGYYDTREEDAAAASDSRDARGLGRLITKYDTQRASDGMDFETRKDAYKRKVVFGNPGDAPAPAKEEEQLKRSRLSLPAPQVSDTDLEVIAKAGVPLPAVGGATGGAGGAAGGLGGGESFMSGARHPLLATPMGSVTSSVAGTPRTSGRGGQVWADVRDQQLRDIVKLQAASTPLVGGDNSVLPKTLDVNGSVTPMATVQQTPNLLATPSVASFGSVSSRDMNDAELARADKARLLILKRDLKKGLDALPDPENEYEISVSGAALPELGKDDDEAAPAVKILEDAEDEAKRVAAEGKKLLASTKRRAFSSSLRRGLPIPPWPLDAKGVTPHVRQLVERDTVLRGVIEASESERADGAVSDAVVAQRLRQVVSPDSDISYIKQARQLFEAEAEEVPEGGGLDVIVSAIREQHKSDAKRLWTVGATGNLEEAKNGEDLRETYRQRCSHAHTLQKSLKTQQRNLELRFGGFQAKRASIQKQLHETLLHVKKAREELSCFTMLAEDEEAALPRRLAELEAALEGEKSLHDELQKEYARRSEAMGKQGSPA